MDPEHESAADALRKRLRYQRARLDFGSFAVTIVPAVPALNVRYAEALAHRMQPHLLAYAARSIGAETSNRVLAETYVDSVIVAWEGDVPADLVAFLVDRVDVLHEVVQYATNLRTFINGGKEP